MTKTSTCLGWILLPLAAACGGRESSAAAPGDAPERATDRAPSAAQQQAPAPVAAAPAGPAAAAQPGAPAAGTTPAAQPAAPAKGGAAPAPAAPSTPAEKANQDRAAEILSRAERTANGIRSLEADFTQSLTVPLLNTTQRSAGKLYQRKPDRFAMRFSDPQGDLIVADGRHFWLYYPSTDRTQAIRTSIAAGGESVDLQQQFLSNANQRFVATVAGEENVGGQATYVLTLVPRGASPYRILKVWVDKDDNLVRRFEMTEENNSVRTVEMRNIRVNPSLADAVFTFTPPEGVQVFDQ
ncbi:MAG TPA: outer membrane lipoprotein chaperone LolA [Longimicrobium sp.]|jgi:outer membrane lipoprotein carrier protein|uniref:outer membrane lipoprotein chaperone LolA n=1 Tax=Longimicrobium sp. TaxID=2029185 RepID=UPI002EDA84D6